MRWKSDLRDADATPEAHYLRRRDFLRLGAAGAIGAVAAGIPLRARAGADDPSGEVLKTASTVNQAGGEKPTPWKSITTYNNFYEFATSKEDPARLAQWVLRDSPEWTPERIDAAMHGERPTQVNLKQKLTVFLFYDTAYVDSKGVMYFADDYYGHDAQLEKALAHGYPYPRKS